MRKPYCLRIFVKDWLATICVILGCLCIVGFIVLFNTPGRFTGDKMVVEYQIVDKNIKTRLIGRVSTSQYTLVVYTGEEKRDVKVSFSQYSSISIGDSAMFTVWIDEKTNELMDIRLGE